MKCCDVTSISTNNQSHKHFSRSHWPSRLNQWSLVIFDRKKSSLNEHPERIVFSWLPLQFTVIFLQTFFRFAYCDRLISYRFGICVCAIFSHSCKNVNSRGEIKTGDHSKMGIMKMNLSGMENNKKKRENRINNRIWHNSTEMFLLCSHTCTPLFTSVER